MTRVALVCALLCLAATARADERACARTRDPGLNVGPVVIGLYDADWLTGRNPCLQSELALYERLGAVVDMPGFYGGVRADTILSGSKRLRHSLELFGALELVHWELVQNATIKATALGLGQLTFGLQGVFYEGSRWVLSGYGRLLLPTASWSPSVQTTGLESGLVASFRPRTDVELHGHAAADFTAGLSAGPADVRGGASLSAGVQYSPARWFGFAVDLTAVLGHRAALDAFLPSLALRFRPWRGLGLELDATAPAAGADRRLALAALRLDYRF